MAIPTFLFLSSLFLTDSNHHNFTREEVISTETTQGFPHDSKKYSNHHNFTREEVISTETTQGFPHDSKKYSNHHNFTREEVISTESTQGIPHELENCQQTVIKLDVNTVNDALNISWKYQDLNSPAIYAIQITHLRKEFCGGKDETSTETVKQKAFIYNNWNGFAPLKVCVQHNEFRNLGCQKKSCIHVPSNISGALAAVDFQLFPKTHKIKAKWKPNSLWSSECSLMAYSLSLIDEYNEKVLNVSSTTKKMVFKELKPKKYNIWIQPIFDNGMIGTIRSEEAIPCPQAVTELEANLRKNILSITWKDHKLNSQSEYEVEVMHLRKDFCGGENTKKRKLTKSKIYDYSEWNGFAPIDVCVRQHGFESLSCHNEICSRIPSNISGYLHVVDFQLVPYNNMIKAHWKPNPFWFSECRLKSYRLFSIDKSWDKILEGCIFRNYCEETIKDLQPRQYTFSIQPIFTNGKLGTIRSEEITPCPEAVSDLHIDSRKSVLSITWKDHYLNSPAVYEVEIMHLRNDVCGGENTKKNKVTRWKIYKYSEWNGFAPLDVCVRHHGFENLSCHNEICSRIPSNISGFLDVADFQLVPYNNMIKAHWKPNPLWLSECQLKSYRLFSIDKSWDRILAECVSRNYCEATIKDLQPKQYTFLIQPIFKNGKLGTIRSEETTPCPQAVSDLNIKLRNNVLSITWKDHYLNSPAVYEVEITHLRNEFCGGENTEKRKLTKWKIYKYFEWNRFAPLDVCVRHHGFKNQSCHNEICLRIPSNISGGLDVADFQLIPQDNLISAHWKPNPLWSSECRLKSYKLSSTNHTWEKIIDKCAPFNYCEETIKNLQPKEYNFSIQPIFVTGNIGSIRTANVIPCPKAISNIETEEKGQSLEITWSDIDLNPSSYIVQISQLRYRLCGGKNTNSSMLVNQKRLLHQTFSPFIPLMICVQHNLKNIPKDTNCTRSEKCTQIKPVQQIFNMVKNLKSTPKETSVKITWEIPQEWNELCQLQSFKISEETSSKSIIYNKPCPMNLCTYIIDGLKKDTYYKFRVSAKFRYFKKYPIPPSVEVTTLQKYPQTPDEALKVNSDVSLAYNVQNFLSRNCSCEILLKNVKSRQISPYNCLNGQGNIMIPRGKEYNISYKICNSRGCNSSSIKQIWSKPIVHGEVVVLEDSKDHITFLLPSFGDYLTGFVYLMVAYAGHSSLTKSIAISYVNNLLKQEKSIQRHIRSISGTPAKEEIIWHSKLSLTTYRYDLLAKDLGEDVSDNGVYVSTGYVIGTGKNRKVGATDFAGPFFFTSDPIGVICATIFMILLTFLLLGTIIFLWQKKNSGMSRNSRQTLSDETLMEMLKTSTEKSKDTSYQSSTKERNSVFNELTQIQDKKPDKNLEFLNDLSGKKHLLKETNDSTNSSENEYSNLEPNLLSEVDLETYLISAAHSEALVTEFKNIPLLIPGKSMSVATQPGCKEKNRYRNIIPYDNTRVILPLVAKDHSSHYINANFIEIYVGVHGQNAKYIAAQGPMQKFNVISDFWRMVWYQKIEVIVMLTSLIEDNKVKCDQYWPKEDEQMKFQDHILVRNEGSEDKEFFVVRYLTLIRNLETRKVIQYHYTKWPDHNVPYIASPLAQLVNLLRSEHRLGPTVIHCSAGIGRTGCLLLVLMALEEIEISQTLKMKECVLQLRSCRGRLIQTAAQYQFAHALLWTILYEVQSTFPPEEFERISEELLDAARPNNLENSSLLLDQFQWFKNLPNDLTYLTATNENIRYFYNRFENIFPADTKKIEITIGGSSIEEKYINAIAVNGFNQKDTYIVTEYPTIRTLERVWLMIFEKQLSVWILLNEMDTQNEEDYPSIIPDEGTSMSLNQVTIELISKTSSKYFQQSKVRVYVYLKNAEAVNFDCCVIQLRGWSPKNYMPSLGPDSLFDTLDHACDINSCNNPFLLTCLDGVTACGLTLALDITRRRLEVLGEINILSSCVDICYARPEFIISLEQFLLLYSYIAGFQKRSGTKSKTNNK